MIRGALFLMPLLAIGCFPDEPDADGPPLTPVGPEPAPDHDEEAAAVPTPQSLGGDRQGDSLCLQGEEIAFDCDLTDGRELSVCEVAGGALIRVGAPDALQHVVAIEEGEAAFVDAANTWDLQWSKADETYGVHGALDADEPRVFFTETTEPKEDGVACASFQGDLSALAAPEL